MRSLPGPRGLPLLGSLFPFHRGRQLWFLQQVVRHYGDLCGFQVLWQRFAVVNDPKHAQSILANREGNFRQPAPPQLRVLELMKPPAKGLVRGTGSSPSAAGRDREQLEVRAYELTRRHLASWLQHGELKVNEDAGALATWLAFGTLWETQLDEPLEIFLALREALSMGALDKKVPRSLLEARRARFSAIKERLLEGQPEDEHASARRKGFAPVALATVSPLSSALAWALVYLADAPERARNVASDAGFRRAFLQELLRLPEREAGRLALHALWKRPEVLPRERGGAGPAGGSHAGPGRGALLHRWPAAARAEPHLRAASRGSAAFERSSRLSQA
jgi:hypothetical protein